MEKKREKRKENGREGEGNGVAWPQLLAGAACLWLLHPIG